jgi:hypothetical protein
MPELPRNALEAETDAHFMQDPKQDPEQSEKLDPGKNLFRIHNTGFKSFIEAFLTKKVCFQNIIFSFLVLKNLNEAGSESGF